MGGYIGPSAIVTQVDGYNRTQTDALISPTNISDKDNSSTGAFDLPSGTTAQRPASPNTGYTRYNTTIGAVETWNGTAWVTSGGLVLQAVQTASFTATAGNSCPVNTTSAAITVTLPASPTAGQQINIFDYAGTAATNAITINPNGGKINGIAGNSFITIERASLTLVYVDSSQGWICVTIGNLSNIKQNYSAAYLVVAGGGGAAAGSASLGGGGGGAGGLLTGSSTLTIGTTYTVTVGSGGAGDTTGTSYTVGIPGGNSVFSSISTVGGGGGGLYSVAGGPGPNGNGGSGGGAAGFIASGGTGTSGQGNNGGSILAGTGFSRGSAGGGGAGAVGSSTTADNAASTHSGVSGGAGVSSSITGASVTYAGGGGGGGSGSGSGGSGGSGGGGNGGNGAPTAGSSGTTNTGGGGGAGGGGNGADGTPGNVSGNGGSGVVILSIPTASYSGTKTGSPTVTTSGSNTILKFTASGSYTA